MREWRPLLEGFWHMAATSERATTLENAFLFQIEWRVTLVYNKCYDALFTSSVMHHLQEVWLPRGFIWAQWRWEVSEHLDGLWICLWAISDPSSLCHGCLPVMWNFANARSSWPPCQTLLFEQIWIKFEPKPKTSSNQNQKQVSIKIKLNCCSVHFLFWSLHETIYPRPDWTSKHLYVRHGCGWIGRASSTNSGITRMNSCWNTKERDWFHLFA